MRRTLGCWTLAGLFLAAVHGPTSAQNAVLETPLGSCGASKANAGCGNISDVLFVNGSAGGLDRTLRVNPQTPLHFQINEAPAMRGDGKPGNAVIYGWLATPQATDIVTMPRSLGVMCFGPPPIATRSANVIWNSIGAPSKLGGHNAPTPPPIIADGQTLEFFSTNGILPFAILTLQGIIEDDCSRGRIPYSITNGVAIEVLMD